MEGVPASNVLTQNLVGKVARSREPMPVSILRPNFTRLQIDVSSLPPCSALLSSPFDAPDILRGDGSSHSWSFRRVTSTLCRNGYNNSANLGSTVMFDLPLQIPCGWCRIAGADAHQREWTVSR